MLMAIGFATLRPMPGENGDRLPVLCLACGELGTVDVVLNVILFLPLGAALVLAGWSVLRASIFCICASFAIESLQYQVVVGRDSSLSDLMTNSLGGWLGAYLTQTWRTWLFPSGRLAGWGVLGSAVLALGIPAMTGAALRSSVPDGPYYGQYAPLRMTRVQFDGEVRSLVVAGLDIPYSIVDSSEALRDSLTSGRVWMRAEIRTKSVPPVRADIVRLGTHPVSILALSQRKTDIMFRSRLRAADWKLRVPIVVGRGAFPVREASYRVEGSLGTRGWHMETTAPDGVHAYDVPYSALMGWSFFLPFEFPLDERRPLLNALWGACLLVPVGYCLQWRVRRTRERGDSGRSLVPWLMLPPLLWAMIGFIIPSRAGFEKPPGIEILGTVAGIVLGVMLAMISQEGERAVMRHAAQGQEPNDNGGVTGTERIAMEGRV